MIDFYSKIVELREHNVKGVICTLVSTYGSSPRKIGARMIVSENSVIYGTIGGGSLEQRIIDLSSDVVITEIPKLIKIDLFKDLGMKCGGRVEVFLEPFSSKFNLFIFGAGHIGKALADIVRNLDFRTFLIDDRKEMFSNIHPDNINLVMSDYNDFLDKKEPDKFTFIVIVTKGYESDIEIIKKCLLHEFAYIGVIGSKKKSIEIINELKAEGNFSEEKISKLHIPIGLPISSEGPYEIAVSIAAELILEKNRILKIK